jgi:hypothetical protein
MELQQIAKLLYSKGNSYQSEKTAHRMGENLCQVFICQGTAIQNYKNSKIKHKK